jgi:3-oxoacid CoA-transferase subunit B
MIALRVAKELRDGDVVNLGIGLPTLVSNFITPDVSIWLHSENGVLGFGPIVDEDEEQDLEYVNAGSQPITLLPGASFFDSAMAFAMIRTGRVDVTVLGGLQVSAKGDLANWMVPSRGVGSIGGAMDLIAGVKRVIVAMTHTSKNGEPKIVDECTFPLSGRRCVNTIITDLAVIEVTPEGLLLKEVAPGVSIDEVRAATAAPLIVASDCREMVF